MQFLIVRSDCLAPAEIFPEYVNKVCVPCRKCYCVNYWLCGPLEMGAEAVQAQAKWLEAHVTARCPDHPGWFITPDRDGT